MSTNDFHQLGFFDSAESSPLDKDNAITITTQPRSQLPESDLEEEKEAEKRNKRKQDVEDCCCNPYYDPDECEFYLFCQCVGWCCVKLGKCMESILEGCADCISSCCDNERSEDTGGCEDVECSNCKCFD